MTLPIASLRAFTDAAASTVAREIAALRRQAQAERDARDEAFRILMADMDSRLVAAEQQLADRMETVRDGEPGEKGDAGPEGAAGKLPTVRIWEDGVCYEGDVRTAGGATWQAARDTGKQPGHEDWILLAGRGEDGADGVDGQSFRLRGTWIEINDYRALDVVTKDGASFAARTDDPGPCPGDGWQMIARGKSGVQGQRGPVGARGERGEPGLPVVAMSINDEGMLTLVNGDGSTVACDLYPLLSRVAR